MAAEPQPEWLRRLPAAWSHGVTRDGRLFFISEEAKSTTWLHPVTGEAVITGHRKTPDLPTGWEEGYTFEGARCFINHNERKVSCKHPVSGVPSQDNCIFVVSDHVSCATLIHPDGPPQSPAASSSSEEKQQEVTNEMKEEVKKQEGPGSSMNFEVSSYTGGSDCRTSSGTSENPSRRTNIISTSTTTSNIISTSISTTRPSRSSSKKIHNFGKRSNSIKRNLNAQVVKSSWLHKQDSTGMKLWKKRWFVLSDMCLFYYRDEKEDNILGSILLPSFHISMLSVDDHISKKYAFKASHPNMRTYYFCSDSAREMESWMKVLTEAALVHTQPLRSLDQLKAELLCSPPPPDLNHMLLNHRPLGTRTSEVHHNQRNRRQHSLSMRLVDEQHQRLPQRHSSLRGALDYYNSTTLPRVQKKREEGGGYLLRKDGGRSAVPPPCPVHREAAKQSAGESAVGDTEEYAAVTDAENFLPVKNGEKYAAGKDVENFLPPKNIENFLPTKDCNKYAAAVEDGENLLQVEHFHPVKNADNYAAATDVENFLRVKEREQLATQRAGEQQPAQSDAASRYLPPRTEVRRQLSLRESCGTVRLVDRHGSVREVRKYSTLREGDRYAAALRDVDKYATIRGGCYYGNYTTGTHHWEPGRISGFKLQPAMVAAAAVTASRQAGHPTTANGVTAGDEEAVVKSPTAAQEGEKSLSRTGSMQQLEQWVRTQRTRGPEDDARSVTSYQTLPRNMPSHGAQLVARYPEGYRTLPRNGVMRPGSVCSVAGSVYDRALRPVSTPGPTSTSTTVEKRRSMRDDTMWQLYEWQQRQAFSRQSLAPPTAAGHYATLPSSKTMGNISEHAALVATAHHSIPTSPSHGSLALYSTFSPPRQQGAHHHHGPSSEVCSPVSVGDLTLERRQKAPLAKYGHTLERRSIAGSAPYQQTISPQSLQGKTPEELTLMLIQLRRQQAELSSLREHTVAQLVALGVEGPNAKTDVLSHHLQRNLVYLDSQRKENEPIILAIHTMIENSAPRPQLYQQTNQDEVKEEEGKKEEKKEDNIDAQLSRLCEQDRTVRLQEEKLQQLHREKHTLETALLSASQELREGLQQSGCSTSSSTCTSATLVQQKEVLQSGLLSTCRELSRVNAEVDRCWREYDKLSADVTLAKSDLLEELEALGSPQTEPPSQRHIQIQKQLWRIQDVMELLAKNRPTRSCQSTGDPGAMPLSSLQKDEEGEGAPLPHHRYDSFQRPSHTAPPASAATPAHHHRLPPAQERKERNTRNGAHSQQGPDYRLYKSEPELTTVNEEVDEAHSEVKVKDEVKVELESEDATVSEAPPHAVMGAVPPRTKSPHISSPESCTIASYVTLRKSKKTDSSRWGRPRSAAEQQQLGEVRSSSSNRMSVEEQLERMRRNQEASTLLRGRRKETPFINLQEVKSENECEEVQQEAQQTHNQLEDPGGGNGGDGGDGGGENGGGEGGEPGFLSTATGGAEEEAEH
ncbi:pleckstrin homology domain-containing family A member 5-like isoform X5 [Nelusetta ayraudi]|uniref:pleckstrin homology domain-containing family A member 5-like isoform X5 n=1 Tax=Nelusetta ayraudi TaxID=303726 RepID=UPI003F6FB43E